MGSEIAKRSGGDIAPAEDVSKGGIGAQDIEIPRALILQALSPDVTSGGLKAGIIINNISKEELGNEFVPIFAFKQYAKFNESGKITHTTMDRTDPEVASGLKWVPGVNKGLPVYTEFINVMVVFKSDTSMPCILSFKRKSFRVGKQFLTLLSIKPKPYYRRSYSIALDFINESQKSYYVPRIKPIQGDAGAVDSDLQELCGEFGKALLPVVKNVGVGDDGAKPVATNSAGDDPDESIEGAEERAEKGKAVDGEATPF